MWTTKEKARVKEMDFKGFYGGKVKLRIESDSSEQHDHLVININGEDKVYLHIDQDCLSIFPAFEKKGEPITNVRDFTKRR